MENLVDNLVGEFEAGRITRRQLVKNVGALAGSLALLGGARPGAEATPFTSVGLNHIALRVTDVKKSRDFYTKLLGLKTVRENLPGNCFMTTGENFVALFQSKKAAMDHYCYSVKDYDVKKAAKTLEAQGIKPEVHGNRIYFPDPDGLKVQLSSKTHKPN